MDSTLTHPLAQRPKFSGAPFTARLVIAIEYLVLFSLIPRSVQLIIYKHTYTNTFRKSLIFSLLKNVRLTSCTIIKHFLLVLNDFIRIKPNRNWTRMRKHQMSENRSKIVRFFRILLHVKKQSLILKLRKKWTGLYDYFQPNFNMLSE